MHESVSLTFFAMDNSEYLKHFRCIKHSLTRCNIVFLTKEKSATQRCFTSVKISKTSKWQTWYFCMADFWKNILQSFPFLFSILNKLGKPWLVYFPLFTAWLYFLYSLHDWRYHFLLPKQNSYSNNLYFHFQKEQSFQNTEFELMIFFGVAMLSHLIWELLKK